MTIENLLLEWQAYLPFIGLAAVLIAALLLVVLGVWLVRSSRVAAPAGEAPAAAAKPAPAPETGAAVPLRRTFDSAAQALRRLVSGRDWRYQVPCFLLIGDNAAGKSEVLDGLGLNLPLGRPFETAGLSSGALNWWLFEHGIVLDIAGDYVGSDGKGDEAGWRRVLRLIERQRPQRPLDGIVLAFSAEDFIGPKALSQDALAAKGAALNQRLWQLQKQFGMNFPIYVLVTRTERMAGFDSFWHHVPAERHREIFGWSSPYAPSVAFALEWVGEAFAALRAGLARMQLELAANPRATGDPDGMFLFPGEFANLEKPLGDLLRHLFRPSVYYDPFIFRGIYFTGSLRDGTTGQISSILATDLFERKIFREHGLAGPLSRALLSRNRTVAALRAATIGFAVLVGGGFAIDARQLSEEVANLTPRFAQIADTVLDLRRREQQARAVASDQVVDTAVISFLQRDEAIQLLDLMARIDSDMVVAPFMPTSWFSDLHDRKRRFLTIGFDNVIMRAMLNELNHRTSRAIRNANAERRGVSPQQSETDFDQLRNYVAELREIERLASAYNALPLSRDLNEFLNLVRTLFNVELPQSFLRLGHLYRDALHNVQEQPFDFAVYRGRASTTLRTLAWRIYEQTFQAGPVGRELFDLTALLRELSQRGRGVEADVVTMSRVLEALDRVQDLLERPENRWLVSSTFVATDEQQRVLAEITASPFFQPGLAADLATAFQSELERFQARLAAFRSPFGGAVLSHSTDGKRLILAPSLLALRDALHAMFQQEFMQLAPVQPIATVGASHRRLTWKVVQLERALDLYAQFDRFVIGALDRLPLELRERAQGVAVARLGVSMTTAVARAQQFADPVERSRVGFTEDRLENEVRNFQAAAPALGRLITIFRQLDLVEAASALQRAATDQAQDLLFRVDQLLDVEGLYRPVNPIDLWNADRPAAFMAFEAADAEELQYYVEMQRERVFRLTRNFAEPLVGFLASYDAAAGIEERGIVVRWQRMIDAVARYQNRRPDSTLAQLERFIRFEMNAVTPANCAERIRPTGVPRSGDFFVERRWALESELLARCQDLQADKLIARYNALANRFNATLAGRYPFAVMGMEDGPEADPEAIRAFFREFGSEIEKLSEQLRSLPDDEPGRDAAVIVLDQLLAARKFLLTKEGITPGREDPYYAVSAEFRVNRKAEVGGSNIIVWNLLVGRDGLRQTDKPRPLLWRLGDPVTMTLRWAKDSQIQPVGMPTGHPRVAAGTVEFEYRGRWALIRFLQRHVVRDAPTPNLLELEVETKGEMQTIASSRGEHDRPRARVFVNVEVTFPQRGDQKGELLSLPEFPVRAPDLGRSGRSG